MRIDDPIFGGITPIPFASMMIHDAFAIYTKSSPAVIANIQAQLDKEKARVDALQKNELTDYLVATLAVFQAYIDLWRSVKAASDALGYEDAR